MTTVQRMEKKHRNQDKLDKTLAVLRQFPHGIRIVDLTRKVGVKRTTVYGLLNTLDRKGKAFYERGTAYFKDPTGKERYSEGSPELGSLRERLSFLNWLEKRAERKQHEKLKNKELEEKDLRRRDCEYEILTEESNLRPDEDSQERSWQIRKKWEEQFGLNETSTS